MNKIEKYMKKIILVLLLAVPLICVAQNENPDDYAEKAIQCFDDGNDKAGMALLKKGAKLGSARCCNLLGDYHNNLEEYKKAAKWYTQANDPEGWYEHGCLWLQGNLGKQDSVDMLRGLALVRSAERANYPRAIYLMARLFDAGAFVDQNYDSAVYMLRRLPNEGSALFMLARYYEEGTGVELDSLQAMEHFRRAGEAGFGDGYSFLGDYYRRGLARVKPDSLQAFNTYMLAAGAPEAVANGMTDVAECYLEGIGTRVDTAKAIYYLRDAVNAGSYKAAALLADMYNYGRGGIEANGDTALMLYQLASQGDDPRGDYMMGAYLYNQGSYSNAIGFLQSAMMHGSSDAAVLYAQALLAGNGVQQEPEKAVELLHQLTPVDQSGQAYLWLGLAYYTGTGAPADRDLAMRMFDTSAAMGNARAMLFIGQLYNGSEGYERDTSKVLYWYERAAAAGNVDAMMQLAGSYLSGESVPRNPQRAAELYQMTANRGNLEALCRLGYCYEQGEGVTLNSRRAYNLYLQAAEQGSSYGMRLLAYCYAQGIYVEQDMKQAADWFLKAANAGDIHSAYILGQLYISGDGVKKNKKEARKWLAMAAEAGHEEAAEMLKTL